MNLPELTPEVFLFTTEEEFRLTSITQSVSGLQADEMRTLLVELARQLILKDKILRHLIKANVDDTSAMSSLIAQKKGTEIPEPRTDRPLEVTEIDLNGA